LFGKILNTFGTRTATAVINLLIAIVVSQFLGAEGKGSQGLIITTIAFILVFANIIGGATLVYLVPRYTLSGLVIPSYIWSLLIGGLSYIFLLAVPIIDRAYILDISLLAVLNSFMTINSSLLIGKEKISSSNFVNLLVPLLTIVTLLIFFISLERNDISSYITALYTAYGAAFLVSLAYLFRFFRKFEPLDPSLTRKILQDLFRLGFLNQIAHITQMLSFRLSYYLLDFFHGEAAVGVYSNAISLTESLWLISKSISLVQYARIANTKDRTYAANLTVRLTKAAFLLSAVLLIPLLVLPVEVYTYVFGDGFEGIKPVIWLLAPGVLMYNVSILTGHYFSGLGKYNVNAMVSGIGLIVSVSAYLLLIPVYSGKGAGIAATLSHTFNSLFLLILFLRHNHAKPAGFIPTKGDFIFLKKEIRNYLGKK